MLSSADLLLTVLLVTAAATDIKSRRIRNWLVFPAVVCGMVNSVLCKGLEGATGSALGILAGTGLLVPFFLLGGIGAGDVKLAAAAGAIKGWEFAIGGIFAGSVLAAVFCLSVAVANGTAAGVLRRTRDFLRYLIVFRAIVPIDTAESKKIPYGFFLCLGFFAVATGAARFF